MRRREQHASMADLVSRIRATAREIDALYTLRVAAEHAVQSGDLGALRRALADLRCAEMIRRGS